MRFMCMVKMDETAARRRRASLYEAMAAYDQRGADRTAPS